VKAKDNLLVALHRWASGQDENFVTEAFAHLLRHLLKHEPVIGVGVLRFLTGDRLLVAEDRANKVTVTTQINTSAGTPDMEVRTEDHLVYVEVKVESGLGPRQLGRYRAVLDASGFSKTTLVLLSRYPVESDEKPDHAVLWYSVAEHLRTALRSGTWQSPLSRHLAEQSVGFLQAKGMTMEKVTWHLPEGVRAAQNLIDMLEEALIAMEKKPGPSFGRSWAGFDVVDSKAWVGIEWSNPTWLCFETEDVVFKRPAAQGIGYGEVVEHGSSRFPLQWRHCIDLASEEVHFFARSRESQRRRTDEFLTKGFSGLEMIVSAGSEGG